MRLTVTQFMTLDGVVQGPGAPEEDPSDGFDLGGWLPPHFDEAVGASMGEIFQVADEFLLGRRTYDLMAAYWPGQTNPDGSAFELNALPKHVATAQTDELAWEGSVRLDGDTAAAVAELKRRPGRELQVHGSGTLVSSLMAADLVDAYRLLVFPVALDAGEVAVRLVELSLGEPSGLVPDIGGPRVYELTELLRSYLRASHRHRLLVPVRLPGKAAGAVLAGANLAPEQAVGQRTWEDFLAERLR